MFKPLRIALIALAASILPAKAEEWPTRQVTIVAPFPTGGTADLLGRLLAEHLEQEFHQPFVVEDKPGASGSVGSAYVAKAEPDGYTILVGAVSTHAINPSVYPKLPYDAERDFEPVTLVAQLPNLLVISPTMPVKSIPELVEYLNAHPYTVTYGSAGPGTSQHMAAELFKLRTGTKITHVPFHGANEIMEALKSGKIQMAFNNMMWSWPFAKSGAVRALAVTSPTRSPSAPDVPALAETLKGYDADSWFGLFVPAKTPRAVVERLSIAVKNVLAKPFVLKQLSIMGVQASPSTPEQFATFIRTERKKWSEVVKAADVKME